jgi:hypothetical protein
MRRCPIPIMNDDVKKHLAEAWDNELRDMDAIYDGETKRAMAASARTGMGQFAASGLLSAALLPRIDALAERLILRIRDVFVAHGTHPTDYEADRLIQNFRLFLALHIDSAIKRINRLKPPGIAHVDNTQQAYSNALRKRQQEFELMIVALLTAGKKANEPQVKDPKQHPALSNVPDKGFFLGVISLLSTFALTLLQANDILVFNAVTSGVAYAFLLIVFVWSLLKHALPHRERRIRLFAVALSCVAFGAMAAFAVTKQYRREHSVDATQHLFSVHSTWIEYSGPVAPDMWFVQSGTVTPVYAAMLIHFTNLRAEPTMIFANWLERQEPDGTWHNAGLRFGAKGQIFAGKDRKDAVELRYETFDASVENRNIAPKETVLGWVFFTTPLDRPTRFAYTDAEGIVSSEPIQGIASHGFPNQNPMPVSTHVHSDLSELPLISGK